MSFYVWASPVHEAEESCVKLRRRRWQDPVRMWCGVLERKVDGRGTGLCPPECPVRPHDRIVQPYAHMLTEALFNARKTIKGNVREREPQTPCFPVNKILTFIIYCFYIFY